MDPMVGSSWKSKDYSALAERIPIVGGEIYGHAGSHLRGFRIPNCWGWIIEVEKPHHSILAKGNQGSSLANPNGVLHVTHALHPYQLVGCGGYAGRGCNELLGECSLARCSNRTQASVSTHGPNSEMQWCNNSTRWLNLKKVRKQLRALRQTGQVAGYV